MSCLQCQCVRKDDRFHLRLHGNLSAKTYADEPTFTLQRPLLPGGRGWGGGGDAQRCDETCRPGRSVCLCVCLHGSHLEHLLVDAIMSIGAEVGLVLVLPELSHSSQVAGLAGLCIQHQTLSQQPERTADRSVLNFSH